LSFSPLYSYYIFVSIVFFYFSLIFLDTNLLEMK